MTKNVFSESYFWKIILKSEYSKFSYDRANFFLLSKNPFKLRDGAEGANLAEHFALLPKRAMRAVLYSPFTVILGRLSNEGRKFGHS